MRLHILDDLHNEFTNYEWDIPVTACDVIILAGDIGVGMRTIDWSIKQSERLDKPIIQILGNHELYNNDFSLIERFRNRAKGTNVHFLEMDTVTINDIKFIGTTLWTDYNLYGTPSSKSRAMYAAKSFMSDHRLINRFPGLIGFSPADAEEIHKISLEWLNRELQATGKKVVVTHHAPSPKAIAPQYIGDSLNPAFASDLEGLMFERDPVLWVYGHTHSPTQFKVNNTLVVNNAKGYLRENVKNFDPKLVVEV